MAKVMSKEAAFWLGGYDLAEDTTNLEIASLCGDLESTTMPQAAQRFIAGNFSGEFSHDGLFDDRAGGINVAGAALIGTTPVVTVAVEDVAGKRAMSGLVLHTAYTTPATLGGLIVARITGVTDNKVEIALVLQEKVAKTGNFDSASVNNNGSSANGGVGFLHVFAANGTADVVIEESPDDGVEPFATKLTFAQFSGISSERVSVSGTVEQYLRVALTLGTATSVTYAVTFARG